MKKTNTLIYVSFIVHIAITLLAGLDEEIILYFMAIPLLANLIGLYFLSFTENIKLGAKIFMYSSFVFVPIGMIGIIGSRKVLDKIKEEEFFSEETTND